MTQVLTTHDKYLADYQELSTRFPNNGSKWLHEVREGALASFDRLRLPTRTKGNEAWKYTNIRALANTSFQYAFTPNVEGVKAAELKELAPWDDSWASLVFVDGHYVEALSTAASNSSRVLTTRIDGAKIGSLADAMTTHKDVVEAHLAKYALAESDGFTAMNTAFLNDGAFVYIPKDSVIEQPLHIIFITAGDAQPTVSHPRILVVLEENSSVTIVESYLGVSSNPYFTNSVTEIVLGDGARAERYKLLMENANAFHIDTTQVYQNKDSAFRSVSFAKGAAIARNNISVLLDSPGSDCFLRGLYLTSGSQHIDNHIDIDHAKPHAKSDIYFKGILSGRSKAVFSGRVLVRKDAQKSSAVQRDKNLLLSKGAEVDSSPSLEIYADDVQCSHGATAGAMAEDALFYMMSRGLDVDEATRFLIHGFAREILDEIRPATLHEYAEKKILGSLPSLRSGQEL